MAKNTARKSAASAAAMEGESKTNNLSEKDAEAAKAKMAELAAIERVKDLELLNEAKKLKKVKVSKEDLATIMTEFMLSKAEATLTLQRSGLATGKADVTAAVRTLVGAL